MGCGGARLHAAGEGAVEGGDAHADAATVGASHGAEDVEVALHPCGLGDDHHRMPAFGEHFEDGAGDPEIALDRLVGVGVGPQRDRGALVSRLAELRAQQGRGVRLEHEPGLEVEAGREPEVSVARPGVAVDAPVFAAPVGVDGAVEGEVRRVVPGDDLAGRVSGEGGAELRRRCVVVVPIALRVVLRANHRTLPPAVIEVLPGDPLEPADGVAERTAALAGGGPVAPHRHGPRLAHGRRGAVRRQTPFTGPPALIPGAPAHGRCGVDAVRTEEERTGKRTARPRGRGRRFWRTSCHRTLRIGSAGHVLSA